MLFGAVSAAVGQDFPSRTVRMVVGFAPGGANDTIARNVAAALQARWGQTVVVENKTGSGGHIGADAVAKATPDGTRCT